MVADSGAGDIGPSPGADPAGSAATITQSRRDRIPGLHRGFSAACERQVESVR